MLTTDINQMRDPEEIYRNKTLALERGNTPEWAFKIVIVGAGGVGKTCLFNRYCFNSFDINCEMTIGINFHSTVLPFRYKNDSENDNKEKYIVNSIFDFGGQERFKPLLPKFLKGADGALLLFDSVSYSSFEKLNYWYEELKKNIEDESNIKIPKLLIGCKSDLLKKTSPSEIVDKSVIDEFIEERKIDGFKYTSALENVNILEVFNHITRLLLKKRNIEAILGQQ